jgi:hypothetical protein
VFAGISSKGSPGARTGWPLCVPTHIAERRIGNAGHVGELRRCMHFRTGGTGWFPRTGQFWSLRTSSSRLISRGHCCLCRTPSDGSRLDLGAQTAANAAAGPDGIHLSGSPPHVGNTPVSAAGNRRRAIFPQQGDSLVARPILRQRISCRISHFRTLQLRFGACCDGLLKFADTFRHSVCFSHYGRPGSANQLCRRY